MDQVKYEGVPHLLGGTTYIVPGLSTKQMRGLKDRIARAIALEQGTVEDPEAQREAMFEVLDITVDVAHAAISRNYEGISIDDMSDWVDMNNARPLMMSVMGQSGMKLVREVPSSEGGTPGEN